MNNIYIFAPANEEKGCIFVQRFFQFAAGCSAALLVWDQVVAGSNPVAPTDVRTTS